MRASPFWMPLLVIVGLLGTVGFSQVMGLWTTSGRTDVNLATLKPADIKGWMTVEQVMQGLDLSQQEFYAIANLPGDVPPSTALKDIEKIVEGFEISTLRTTLQEQPGESGEQPE